MKFSFPFVFFKIRIEKISLFKKISLALVLVLICFFKSPTGQIQAYTVKEMANLIRLFLRAREILPKSDCYYCSILLVQFIAFTKFPKLTQKIKCPFISVSNLIKFTRHTCVSSSVKFSNFHFFNKTIQTVNYFEASMLYSYLNGNGISPSKKN